MIGISQEEEERKKKGHFTTARHLLLSVFMYYSLIIYLSDAAKTTNIPYHAVAARQSRILPPSTVRILLGVVSIDSGLLMLYVNLSSDEYIQTHFHSSGFFLKDFSTGSSHGEVHVRVLCCPVIPYQSPRPQRSSFSSGVAWPTALLSIAAVFHFGFLVGRQ